MVFPIVTELYAAGQHDLADVFQTFDVFKCTPGRGVYGNNTVAPDAHDVG
jgi:hypothetical protein